MAEYEFSLIIDGDLDDEDVIVRLYDAGCDDATFSGQTGGVGIGEFARDADSLLDAIVSAITDVESVAGLRVRRVEPDDLVTIAEIADRLDRTPESIRLLANGQRGGGMFPAPISHMRTRNRLWRWSDIAAWADELSPEAVRDGQLLARINAELEVRNSPIQVDLMGALEASLAKARKAKPESAHDKAS